MPDKNGYPTKKVVVSNGKGLMFDFNLPKRCRQYYSNTSLL